jgi:hypothetical protein
MFALGRLALSAFALCALTACGGGGDSGSDSATVTVLAGTASTTAGAYSSSKKTQEVLEMGTPLGKATAITFEFNTFDVGVSVINNDPSIYVVGFSDDTDGYVCVVAKASAQTGYRACPIGTSVDLNAKTATFNNAVLAGLNSSSTVTVSGQLSWK